MTDEYLLRILLALVVGALLGAEREYRDKAAGFRTIMLICVSSALFAIISVEVATDLGAGDPTRIAAGTVTGVGFLGAGVIMRLRGRVTGITTAASIWAAAGLGLGFGMGLILITLATSAAILVVLWALPQVEFFIDRQQESITYRIVSAAGQEKLDRLEASFLDHGLKWHSRREAKEDGQVVVQYTAVGRSDRHRSMMADLFADPEVLAFET